MQVQIVSDLHCDFYKGSPLSHIEVLADTLIVAGDVSEGHVAARHLAFAAKRWKNVLYVLGNHEYYKIGADDLYASLHALNRVHPNIHWLHRSSVAVEDKVFHGATLWFANDPMNVVHARSMADFSCIPEFVPWCYNQHAADKKYLARAVQPGQIVITHHLPGFEFIDAEYRGSQLNRYFASNQSAIIAGNRPSAWIHGHSHKFLDVTVGGCRVVRNPLGYPSEYNGTAGFVMEV